MRKQRTIYYNDARHYYLFVYEPPMSLQDAWAPIDEIAGTGIDTFCYGVERGDGLFYPSQHGGRFGADIQPFEQAAYWRTWHNMQSLIDQGLDPLRVLIDRAHEKGMDFIVSLRMGGFGGMDSSLRVANGGPGLGDPGIRAHQLKVLQELATYPIEGIELDLATPGGTRLIQEGEGDNVREGITEYVEVIADLARKRSLEIGARVLPTEPMNLSDGMDVREWLRRGLLDFTVPLRYGYMVLDPDLPLEWLVEAAHASDSAVYGMLQPYSADASTGEPQPIHATPAHIRAAAANYRMKGVDGLYTWFLPWPMGETEKGILSDLSDGDLTLHRDKHYILPRNEVPEEDFQYQVPLPVAIKAHETGIEHEIPFHIADDMEVASICEVILRMNITDLVAEDRIAISLNGKSLDNEKCTRDFGHWNAPYVGQWLTFHLETIRPETGYNQLVFTVEKRPDDLAGTIRINDVEIIIAYGPYVPKLNP